MVKTAALVVASSKATIPNHLNTVIVDCCLEALERRGNFTIALSGGSLPKFLASLKETFVSKNVDPKFDSWHVILADERCVPSTDNDSNLGALKTHLFSVVPEIPESQIHGINEEKLNKEEGSTNAVADDYESLVRDVLNSKSDGKLDLAVLGFGPDGHTCSLFPHHALLKEDKKWVAAIDDSPKPPPSRITLTFPLLNSQTRHVIFCGAGSSKKPIIEAVFSKFSSSAKQYCVSDGKLLTATITEPPPFPCSMVYPNSEGDKNTLTWVVDNDAMDGITLSNL